MKKALIIGPTYTGANALASTVNNIANWKATLPTRGFTSISTKSGRLTRSVIQSAIKTFVTGLKVTDQAAIILLGHGGRIYDTSDDEADGYDEAFASSEILPITDDWIRSTLALSKTNKLDIVHDFCYAGTSTRASRPQNAPPAIDSCMFPQGGITFDPMKRVAANRSVPPITNHRLWAAGGESEITYGVMSGGKAHSIFSLGLCHYLRTYPAMNALDLMAATAAYVTGYIPGQHPQLEGIGLSEVPF
jgi:hypothetical protein